MSPASVAQILEGIPEFESTPKLRQILGEEFGARKAKDGDTLVTQGEAAAGWFILATGTVEIWEESGETPLLLNVLGPGAEFGAESVLSGEGVTNATVRAVGDVEYLWLSPARLGELLAKNQELAKLLATTAEKRRVANLLARVGPFVDLDPSQRLALAERVVDLDVDPMTILMREGKPGDHCFVIVQGTAEVLVASDGGFERVAEIGPGGLVGEGALLTNAPRNASVRMMESGRIVGITRDDFLSVVKDDPGIATEVVTLLRMRWRPKQRPGIEVFERHTGDGDVVVTLKDPARNAYYRMAEDGRFIWDRLDGHTTLRELALAYLQEYGRFDPGRIAEAVQGLVDEGFATTPVLRDELAEDAPTGLSALGGRAIKALAWTRAVRGVDRWFDWGHRWIGRWLFSRAGVAVMTAIAIAGLLVTVAEAPRSTEFLDAAGLGSIILLALIPANAIGAVLHEAAHGLTVKRFGREVKAAGVGWFLITPVAFVDTSDMWLESRPRRALVSAAGPFMNLVLGALGAIVAATSDSAFVVAIAWQFAFASYYLAVLNLNPLLEFDGYYILSDALDRPNLREEALAWLGDGLPRVVRGQESLRGHGVDLADGALALLYILVMAFFVVVVYRIVLQDLVAGVVPAAIASGLAWLFAGGLAGLLLLATLAQIRGKRAPSH